MFAMLAITVCAPVQRSKGDKVLLCTIVYPSVWVMGMTSVSLGDKVDGTEHLEL